MHYFLKQRTTKREHFSCAYLQFAKKLAPSKQFKNNFQAAHSCTGTPCRQQRNAYGIRPRNSRSDVTYPAGISNKEREFLESLLVGAARPGRPRKSALHEVINALRYLV